MLASLQLDPVEGQVQEGLHPLYGCSSASEFIGLQWGLCPSLQVTQDEASVGGASAELDL